MTSFQPEGHFETPGFGDPDYKGDFYSKSQSLNFVLDLPHNIGELVGEGALVISVGSFFNLGHFLIWVIFEFGTFLNLGHF